MATELLLEGRGVSVTFGRGPRAIAAVKDVSVAAPANMTVGIVGESGSGKTSLARVLVGSRMTSRHFPFRLCIDGERGVKSVSK